MVFVPARPVPTAHWKSLMEKVTDTKLRNCGPRNDSDLPGGESTSRLDTTTVLSETRVESLRFGGLGYRCGVDGRKNLRV